MPNKIERVDPLGVFNIHFVAKHQKIEGDPLGKKVTMPKKLKGGTLWSRPVWCYARKQEKPFWFSSLGQLVQFGAIIFCRTFGELFWSVQVVLKNTDEKPLL